MAEGKGKMVKTLLKLLLEILFPFLVELFGKLIGKIGKKQTGLASLINLAHQEISACNLCESEYSKKYNSIKTKKGIFRIVDKQLVEEKNHYLVEAEKSKARAEVWKQVLEELSKHKGLLDKEQKDLRSEIEKELKESLNNIKKEDIEEVIKKDASASMAFDEAVKVVPGDMLGFEG